MQLTFNLSWSETFYDCSDHGLNLELIDDYPETTSNKILHSGAADSTVLISCQVWGSGTAGPAIRGSRYRHIEARQGRHSSDTRVKSSIKDIAPGAC